MKDKRWLEELKKLEKCGYNFQLEYLQNGKGVILQLTVDGETYNLGLHFPQLYPKIPPNIYNLDRPSMFSRKVKMQTQHQFSKLSLCLYPQDAQKWSWQQYYYAVDVIEKFEDFIINHNNPDIAFTEHTSISYPFPGTPDMNSFLYIPQEVFEEIKNKKEPISDIITCCTHDQRIFYAASIKPEMDNQHFNTAGASFWNGLSKKCTNMLKTQYLFLPDQRDMKEETYRYRNFEDWLKETNSINLNEYTEFLIIIFSRKNLCIYNRNQENWSEQTNMIRFTPGKIVKVPDSFFKRASDFFQDMFKSLREKKVTMIGLGSIGSSIALELVKNGVENIDLYDYDILQPENISRHICNINQIGDKKTAAVKKNLLKINPEANIISHPINPFSGRDYQNFCDNARNTDLFIISTGRLESEIYVNETALKLKKNAIFCWANGKVSQGEFFILNARNGPCYNCLLNYRKNDKCKHMFSHVKRREIDADEPGIVPYNAAGVPGVSIDIGFIALFTSRLAIQTLLEEEKNFHDYYPRSLNCYYYWNREKDGESIMSFGPRALRLERYESCPSCTKKDSSPIMTRAEKRKLQKLTNKYKK